MDWAAFYMGEMGMSEKLTEKYKREIRTAFQHYVTKEMQEHHITMIVEELIADLSNQIEELKHEIEAWEEA